MQVTLSLRKKGCSEWIRLTVHNYNQIQDVINRLYHSLSTGYVKAKNLAIQAMTLNDELEKDLFIPSHHNLVFEKWIQALIDNSFESGCHHWAYHSTPRGPWISILGRNYELKKFTMRFLHGEKFNNRKIQERCGNNDCINPNHLFACKSSRQKLLDPEQVLQYIDDHPELTQSQVARIFNCSNAAISRLVNKKTFAELDRTSQYVL